MESDSELSDNILTNTERKRLIKINSGESASDCDCDEIVVPFRKLCRIIFDDEEESRDEDCEINLTSKESGIWKCS